MPRKSQLKCYFGCVIDGPLHHFPKPQWWNMERFNLWKAVLKEDTQMLGDNYIFHQVRLCYKHFEHYYRLPSNLLTKNAIPTLNLGSSAPVSQHQELVASQQVATLQIATTSQDTKIPDIMIPVGSEKITINKRITYKTCPKKTAWSQENKRIIGLTMQLKKLKEKCKNQNLRIRKAEKISYSRPFLKEIEMCSKPAKIFFKMQKKSMKKPRGRRYSLKEKIIALTILKQSAKGYNFLKKIFTLPSKRTLQKLTKLLSLKAGINQEIFDNIKIAAKKYPIEKKLVTLIFDEVSLAPGLLYNKSADIIEGFEDSGTKRSQEFADHALVFMIKGLKGKFKQPICFTFVKSATKTLDLKQLIIALVKKINESGLIVVATICDQSSTNVAAINSLKADTKQHYLRLGKEYKTNEINIEGIIFYPLYDPPHLLKGIRNNLLTKNLRYVQNNNVKIAKWEHLEILLRVDVGDDEARVVNKLTEAHVLKDKIPKMKVKHAAQVFSQRVSSALRFSARHKIIPEECEQTADLLLIFDKLFDSFNGHTYSDSSKIFKGCLKEHSRHFILWKEMLPILRSMGFERKRLKDGNWVVTYEKVPSITNFISNIETMKRMWTYVKNTYNVTSILTRNLNQDPLENFFCQIRSNGIRNTNPTVSQFINAYKTLLINNFSSPHSLYANCEKDENSSIQSVKLLFKKKSNQKIALENIDIDLGMLNATMEHEFTSTQECLLHTEAKNYISGYVLKKLKTKIFKKCVLCAHLMVANEEEKSDFIKERDQTNNSLMYPSKNFQILMNNVYFTIVQCLRKFPTEQNLIQIITLYIDLNCEFRNVMCEVHKLELIPLLINISLNIIIHSWCKGDNRILSGKIKMFDVRDEI